MTSKISNILADKEKQKKNQVINRNISELWSGYKSFKAKFHAHHAKLEQFTLKVLKLSFFTKSRLKDCGNRLKNPKLNIKAQLALIKTVLSIHLRSLQIEQRLFQENHLLKELLNHSYKIVIKDKYSAAASEIRETKNKKNVKAQEKCFKSGLEYIFHELEAVSNKTKFKRNRTLDGDKFEADPAEIIDLSRRKSEKFDLQIDLEPPKMPLVITDISQVLDKNLTSMLEVKTLNQLSLNSLVFDLVKPIHAETVLYNIEDTRDKKQMKTTSANSWKNVSTFKPNNFTVNFIGLFCPVPFLFKKLAILDKQDDQFILQKEIPCVQPHPTSNIKFKFDSLTTSEEMEGEGEGEHLSNHVREESLNLSELKTLEFYDIPSSSDIHDYTLSWLEQQNEKDFCYLKKPEQMLNNTNTNGQTKKRQSIMKKSVYTSRQNNFKDYLKNIITYSEEFYSKKNSSFTTNPSTEKKKKRLINFPSSCYAESNRAGKYNFNNTLEHNQHDSSNYKLPKMPDMNKAYQIIFQQNMTQGFSLKFVKSKDKDVSTLIVSNRYPTSMPSFPKTTLYKK